MFIELFEQIHGWNKKTSILLTGMAVNEHTQIWSKCFHFTTFSDFMDILVLWDLLCGDYLMIKFSQLSITR